MRTRLLLFCALAALGCRAHSEGGAVKMIGGTVAQPGEYPATMNLSIAPDAFGNPRNFCTGAFITPTHILTAAHCVFEYTEFTGGPKVVNRKDKLAAAVYVYFGPNSEAGYEMSIKATYLPDETVAFLAKNKGWVSTADTALAVSHDVAIIETALEAPDDVPLVELSSQQVKAGMAFRYGGYGCEMNVQIPSSAPVTSPGKASPLKYAKATVESATPLVGFGPSYTGLAKQSACPGDSGGPVFAEPGPGGAPNGIYEVIGVNSFAAVGGPTKQEVAFQIVTKTSKLGGWIAKVRAGQVAPVKKKTVN